MSFSFPSLFTPSFPITLSSFSLTLLCLFYKKDAPFIFASFDERKSKHHLQSMVDSVASECLTKYHNHGHGSGGGTRSRRMSVRTLEKALTLDPEEAAEEDAAEDFSSTIQEDDGWRGVRMWWRRRGEGIRGINEVKDFKKGGWWGEGDEWRVEKAGWWRKGDFPCGDRLNKQAVSILSTKLWCSRDFTFCYEEMLPTRGAQEHRNGVNRRKNGRNGAFRRLFSSSNARIVLYITM